MAVTTVLSVCVCDCAWGKWELTEQYMDIAAHNSTIYQIVAGFVVVVVFITSSHKGGYGSHTYNIHLRRRRT